MMKKQKFQLSLKSSLILIAFLGIFLIIFMSVVNDKRGGLALVNKQADSINKVSIIDTSNWVTFEDKELGISYKHPVDCWQNGAGPGTDATNIVNCYDNVFMAYQPINYSYNKESFNNFDNLGIKDIAEQIRAFNNGDDSVHKVEVKNYDAYQFVTNNNLSIPCKEKYGCASVLLVTDKQIDATFVENSEKNKILLILTPDSDNLSKEILKTFKFIDDNQVTNDMDSLSGQSVLVNYNIPTVDKKILGNGYFIYKDKLYFTRLYYKNTTEVNFENYFDVDKRNFLTSEEIYRLDAVDPNNFVVIGKMCAMGGCLGIGKDKKYVYSGESIASRLSEYQVDVASFVYLKYNFYKDKNALYYYGMGWGRANFVDLGTFEFIDNVYSKDKNNVYQFMDGFNIVKGADPKTFKVPVY